MFEIATERKRYAPIGHWNTLPINRTPAEMLQLGDVLPQRPHQEDATVILSREVIEPYLLFLLLAARGTGGALDVVLDQLDDAGELGDLLLQVVVAVKVEKAVQIVETHAGGPCEQRREGFS